MAEQIGTPGSNADLSVNGGKTGAPKDKACPFCQQQFTSSSLGRHLDLYIKEKNPKPADGVHDVDEIRKLRGGITRRQPRNSTSRREDSTPADTPGAGERRSPRPESERQGNRSPSLRRDDTGSSDIMNFKGRPSYYININKPSWESTGVMNNIPPLRNGDSRSWDGEDRDTGRRIEGRNRPVSKQMLAKTTFEQKQKMVDALDNARAAELALRELMGSFRAAKQRLEGPNIFDYDPLTLDFPALCLHCLPPPPTLYQSTPIATSTSWSILPPDNQQYEALRAHFSAEFSRWRVSCAIATTAPQDNLSYPPPSSLFNLSDPQEITQRAEEAASELENKIDAHLNNVFAQWTSLPPPKRAEIWTLELARSIGRKDQEIQKLKKDKEFNIQQNEHLKIQVDELSRLQHPREFKLSPPTTMPMDPKLMHLLGELGMSNTSVGFNLMDKNLHLDTVVERAIGRWKGVLREARGNGGLAGQRSLSGESSSAAVQQPLASNPTPVNRNTNGTGLESIGSDQDADADADMEEDDSFVEMSDVPPRAPTAADIAPTANFRLANGNRMEGMEGQVVQGYVRIGA